jgi:predicted DNA-binding protein (MmcQ/YjbR family)
MSKEWIRSACLAMPGVTETIQWEDHMVFKVGGKSFAIAGLTPDSLLLTLKLTPERFAEMTERPGVIPAPYLARSHWIGIEAQSSVSRGEVLELLKEAHATVAAKLPKKTRLELGLG